MNIVLVFLGILAFYLFVIDDKSDQIMSIITLIIVLVVVFSLLIRSSRLIFSSMNTGVRSVTIENLEKIEVIIMEVLKKKILAIRQTDVYVFLFGGIGILGIFLGSIVVNLNPPNYPIGYPTMSIGFACFVFAVSLDNSIKTGKRMDQILESQRLILEEMKKRCESELK